MYLLGTLFWIFLSGLIAYGIGRLVTFKLKSRWWRWGVAVVLFPLIFMAPLADEIITKPQFDQLCEAAKVVKVYGSIPVGQELYTPDGKWRGRDTGDDPFALNKIYESLLRWESNGAPIASSNPIRVDGTAVPINRFDMKIFDRKTNKLLAEWTAFSPGGSWLGRHFEGNFLLPQRCTPLEPNTKFDQQLLPYSKGETK